MTTASQPLSSRDFQSVNRSRGKKLASYSQALRFALATNANGTQSDVADHEGDIQAINLCVSTTGTASMTFDVLVAGVSVLAGGVPYTHKTTDLLNTLISIPVAANKRIKMGEKVDVVRASFTAGASVVKVHY